MTIRFDVLTLHPEIVRVPLASSIIGRACEAGLMGVGVHDIRDHAPGRHRQVDDAPYGGGAGMVMKVDIVADALDAVATPASYVVLTSPGGTPFTQRVAERLLQHEHLVIVTGHYEGIDARIELLVDEEISLGDFVLTGGEIAAVAIVDAVARLMPGVLGNEASAQDESFASDLLEYPQYTRPRVWRDHSVPEVLLSGNHGAVARWRKEQAELRTQARRPDLWERHLRRTIIDERSHDE